MEGNGHVLNVPHPEVFTGVFLFICHRILIRYLCVLHSYGLNSEKYGVS